MAYVHELLADLYWHDLLDIAVVSVLVYALLLGLRQPRTRLAVRGILLLLVGYVLSLHLGMRLASMLIQAFVAVLVVAMVIIFQGELRGFFERLAALPFRRRTRQGAGGLDVAALLAQSLWKLGQQQIGALVVLPGRDELTRLIDGGQVLEGVISEPLLASIFDPGSPGHDGAVVVGGERVSCFGAHLPLSTDKEQLRDHGTRHAAALGLVEQSDAVCLVVSEEKGSVSVARRAQLRRVRSEQELEAAIRGHLAGEPEHRGSRRWPVREAGLQLASVLVAAAMWVVFVHEAATEHRSYVLPIAFEGVDPALRVMTQPSEVKLVVSGPRRAFWFVDEKNLGVVVNLYGYDQPGVEEMTLTASDVVIPGGLSFANVFPRVVELRLEATASIAEGPLTMRAMGQTSSRPSSSLPLLSP